MKFELKLEIGIPEIKYINELLKINQYKVKELKISKCNIDDESMSLLMKTLTNLDNINLNSLNLSRNLITDKSSPILLDFLLRNKTLKVINLSSNNFSVKIKDKIKKGSKNSLLKIVI